MGLSAMGINRQLSFCLESANQCSTEKVRCLATPRLAIIKLASKLSEEDENENSRDNEFEYLPSNIDIARGILPSLRHVISQEAKLPGGEEDLYETRPDSSINTLNTNGAIDPHGSDFFCIICFKELGNLYYRCKGCDKLLDKDYNICRLCYESKLYTNDKEMGFTKEIDDLEIDLSKLAKKMTTIRYHTSKTKGRKCGANICKQTVCADCGQCWKCSCNCHQNLKVHRRFYTERDLQYVMDKCVRCAKGEETMYAKETEMRLDGKKKIFDVQIKVPSRYYPNTQNDFKPRRKGDIT